MILRICAVMLLSVTLLRLPSAGALQRPAVIPETFAWENFEGQPATLGKPRLVLSDVRARSSQRHFPAAGRVFPGLPSEFDNYGMFSEPLRELTFGGFETPGADDIDMYTYRLTRLPKQIRQKTPVELGMIEKSGLYWLHKYSVGEYSEFRCRYLVSIRIPSTKMKFLDDGLSGFKQVLGEPGPSTLWFECSIRTDERGFPTFLPEPSVRPVVLMTGVNTYIAWERLVDYTGGDGYPAYRCKIFQFTNYRDAKQLKQIRTRVMSSFFRALEANLKTGLIGAEKDSSHKLAPGERLYVRKEQPSNVLRGSTHELSSYIVRSWLGNEDLEEETEFPSKLDDDRVFLQVFHMIELRQAGSNRYYQASEAIRTQYKRQLAGVVALGVKRTCASFGGRVSREGFGVIDCAKAAPVR